MGLFTRRKSVEEQKPQTTTEGVPLRDEFTDLAEAVVANPSNQTMDAFWKPVFDLETWHFLPEESPDESVEDRMSRGQPIHPLRVRIEGNLRVMMFTSEARALDAAKRNNFAKVGRGFGLLSMPRDAAAAYLCGLTDAEVDGVLVNKNHGEHGMTAPLDNIAAMYEHFFGRVPPSLFDRFVRSVLAVNAPEYWARLYKHFMAMDRWLFIGNPDHPDVPQLVKHQDSHIVLLFTDPAHAAKGAMAVRSADADGQVPIIHATPLEAVSYLENLQRDSAERGQQVTDVLVNLGSVPFVLAIDHLRRFVAMRGSPVQ